MPRPKQPRRMSWPEFLRCLGDYNALKEEMKRRSMIYQYEAKARVAAYFGLTLSEVNLPYPQWARVRRYYEYKSGCQL